MKSQIIKDKINKDTVTKKEMKQPTFQKYYFTETHSKYPSLSYNEILVSLVNIQKFIIHLSNLVIIKLNK